METVTYKEEYGEALFKEMMKQCGTGVMQTGKEQL